MADTATTTNWQNWSYEMREPLVLNFGMEHVTLAELQGVGDRDNPGRFTEADDLDRKVFSGDKTGVRVPLQMAQMQGAGYPSETGTDINQPIALSTAKANIPIVRVLQAASVTVDVDQDSMDNAAVEAAEHVMFQARIAIATAENDVIAGLSTQVGGGGNGLLANVTSVSGSPGLVIPVANANMNVLLPGRIVDIRTRATGADPGNGLRRLIASAVETAGAETITLDTALQAADGGSGNVTFAATEGVFIPGSFSSSAGRAAQSLEDAAAITGTFEGIAKGTTPSWQGTDGRGGDATIKMLSAPLLDAAVARGRRTGVYAWDLGLADPRCIDLYKQSHLTQFRYEASTTTLKSGFVGVNYDGAMRPIPFVKEPSFKPASAKLIHKPSIQVYGNRAGPDFVRDDGSIWRRFNRALPKEFWLLDRFNVGFKRCNTIVFLNNLATS